MPNKGKALGLNLTQQISKKKSALNLMGNQVILHALNPSTQETGKSLSFKFSLVYTVPHQPGLHYKTLSQKKRKGRQGLVW